MKIIKLIILGILNSSFKIEIIHEKNKCSLLNVYFNAVKIIHSYTIYLLLLISKYFRMICVDSLLEDESLPIVTLTTFPARIKNVWMVVYSLYLQTKRPSKIIIYLSKQEFPLMELDVPNNLKIFLNKGLELRFIDYNLKSHNKYYSAFNEYPTNIIITVDDDLFYYPITIERLLALHTEYPNAVCANRTNLISIDNDKFLPYSKWNKVLIKSEPSEYYLALGYAGVLYPSHFCQNFIFDKEKIIKLSLNADDLWLKANQIINNTKVVVGNHYPHPVLLPFSQKISLRSSNNFISDSGNDSQWEKLCKEFSLLNNIKGRLK